MNIRQLVHIQQKHRFFGLRIHIRGKQCSKGYILRGGYKRGEWIRMGVYREEGIWRGRKFMYFWFTMRNCLKNICSSSPLLKNPRNTQEN